MGLSEKILREISDGLRNDIIKQLDKKFDSDYHSNHDVRFKTILNTQGARLFFTIWININQNEKHQVFSIIKNHLEKQYGFNLVNQRLYLYEVIMEFDNIDKRIDPLETYTLLKINQAI